MKRRRILVGLGGFAAAGSLAAGTGAFSSVAADRHVTAEVAPDYDAYLALEEVGEGERSELDGGTVEFNVPGDDEGQYPSADPTDPAGVGPDSVYRFGSDAGGNPGDGLFRVTNQGTETIRVYSTQSATEGVPTVTMFDVDSGELLTPDTPSDDLSPGDSLTAGLQIDSRDVDPRDEAYAVTITINGTVDATEG